MDSTYRLLEKDLQVQQQKVLIQNKNEKKNTAKWNNVDGKQNGQFSSHFTAVSSGEINNQVFLLQ